MVEGYDCYLRFVRRISERSSNGDKGEKECS